MLHGPASPLLSPASLSLPPALDDHLASAPRPSSCPSHSHSHIPHPHALVLAHPLHLFLLHPSSLHSSWAGERLRSHPSRYVPRPWLRFLAPPRASCLPARSPSPSSCLCIFLCCQPLTLLHGQHERNRSVTFLKVSTAACRVRAVIHVNAYFCAPSLAWHRPSPIISPCLAPAAPLRRLSPHPPCARARSRIAHCSGKTGCSRRRTSWACCAPSTWR